MAQPTPDELAKMSLQELEALSPQAMSVGMQRAVTYYRARRWRETRPPVASFFTLAAAEAHSITDEPPQHESLPRTALEVSIDDEVVCTAGLSDAGVLNATLSHYWLQRNAQRKETLSLRVGGFLLYKDSKDKKHLNWLRRELDVGATITLRVVQTDTVDEPQSSPWTDAAKVEARERANYERLKRKFENNE